MSRGGPVYVSCTGTPAQGRSFAWCRGHPEEWGGGGCRLCGGCKREEQPAASVAGRRRSDAARAQCISAGLGYGSRTYAMPENWFQQKVPVQF